MAHRRSKRRRRGLTITLRLTGESLANLRELCRVLTDHYGEPVEPRYAVENIAIPLALRGIKSSLAQAKETEHGERSSGNVADSVASGGSPAVPSPE